MLFGDGFTFDRDLDWAGKMHTVAAEANVEKKSGDNSEANDGCKQIIKKRLVEQ